MQDNQVAVLLEDINGKLDSLADSMLSMNDRLTRVEQAVEPIPLMQKDIETIKLVQREQGKDLDHLTDYLVEQGMPTRA